MKKIMLSLIIPGILLTTNAQIDKNKILERLMTELIPQTEDYNFYQYDREIYIISHLRAWIGSERNDCENAKDLIEMFYINSDTTGRYRNSIDYISDISKFQCFEAYDFLEDQIKNNPSETVRCKAIEFLAWNLNSDYLSCILEYAKSDFLSVQEKLAIATAFTTIGTYTSHSELKEGAIKLLEEVCYNFSSDESLERSCGWNYYKLGGKEAINYHTSLLEQKEGFRRVAMAVVLAELGEYEKTYPIFVEAIQSGVINNVLEAIDGLRVIGTEEALRLIKEQTYSENEKIARKVQETFRNLDKKGGER